MKWEKPIIEKIENVQNVEVGLKNPINLRQLYTERPVFLDAMFYRYRKGKDVTIKRSRNE